MSKPSTSPAQQHGSVTIGVDLGGTSYKLGWLAANGALNDPVSRPTGAHRHVETVLDELAAAISDVSRAAVARGMTVAAIGIGVPAVINAVAGTIELLPNFSQSWQNHALVSTLTERVGLPVHLINDARSFTLAEARIGAGRGVDSLLGITIGTGIGGGLVIDGKLRFGPNYMAGEFGHITIDPNGPRCGCGGAGCVESYASGPALASLAVRPLLQGRLPILRDLIQGDLAKLDAQAVVRAAAAGETECQEFLERVGGYLGLAITHAMKLVDIERVVIGGGVAGAGDALLGPIRNAVKANSVVFGDRQPEIASATVEQPGATGAALWAREKMSEGDGK